jgi:hypothetical protein
MVNKLARIAAVLLAATLVAACGSDSGDAVLTVGATGAPAEDERPPPLPPVEGPVAGTARAACEALTVQEITTAVGNPVRPPTGSEKNCIWGTSVDGGTTVSLSTTKPATAQDCTVQRDSLAKEATKDNVGGLGTSAVWSYQKVAVLLQGTLLACWNDSIVAVMVTGEKDQAALRAAAATLAERAHSRL